MRQSFNTSQKVHLGTEVRVDPRVILSSHILQLTRQELEAAVESELSDNPALERLEEDEELETQERILKTVAPLELAPSSEDFEFHKSLPPDDREQSDWVDLVPAFDSLWDHLRGQLLPLVPSSLADLANYVIDCVNEKGYLETPVEEIALETGSSLEEAESVVAELRNCEPAGVGATSLQDCLLLQLRNDMSVEGKLAKAIVRNHLDDLQARRTTRIVRRYRVMPEVVEAAFELILSLNPFPGEGYRVDCHQPNPSNRSGVTPDLTLAIREGVWEIEVRGVDPASLAVSRSYLKRQKELEEMPNAPKDEKRHVNEYVQRANNFIQSLAQRRRTLRMIGEYLISHQGSFVSTGRYQFLSPLTRSGLAHDIGVHESTVSRATMGKFVQIATGEVVPFEVFFKPALRVQKMIEEITATENPRSPYSDEQIAKMLAAKGVIVARRTVNKYRDKTKLLSSHKRRSA